MCVLTYLLPCLTAYINSPPYQNMIQLIISSKCVFFMLLLKALIALLVLNITPNNIFFIMFVKDFMSGQGLSISTKPS